MLHEFLSTLTDDLLSVTEAEDESDIKYEDILTVATNKFESSVAIGVTVEFKKMFFEGNYNSKVLSKAVEAKQRKKMRDTRSETRIKKGKKRQEKMEHYFGQNTKRSKSASPKKNAHHKPRAKK